MSQLKVLCLLTLSTALVAKADISVSFDTVSAPGLPVGTRLQFNAVATPLPEYRLWYRFRVKPPGGNYTIVHDFGPYFDGSFTYAPMEEGTWEFEAAVKDPVSNAVGTATTSYVMASRILSATPVVSANPDNTLMALYSVPPCATGNVRVQFWPTASPSEISSTRSLACKPGKSLNFHIAGMLANTAYTLRHQTVVGFTTTNGPTLTFTSGTPPAKFVASTVTTPANPATSLLDKYVVEGSVETGPFCARDLSGRVVWYYDDTVDKINMVARPVLGGTFFVMSYPVGQPSYKFLREIDISGMTVKETNVYRLNEQLVLAGKAPVTSIHHDAIRLPNGNTAMLVAREKQLSGSTVLGDGIVVVDKEFQLLWSWDAFDKLDTNMQAVLGEVCAVPLAPGCPDYTGPTPAKDWTHANSLNYTDDGNLIMSIRHLDWVIKIRYSNGAGNGDVIWKLGPSGDMTLTNPGVDPFPFASHQHFAVQKGNRLWLYDNGNTRVATYGGQSRGQVYILNEAAKTATLELNATLSVYALAVGSAQRLANGNYAFGSAFFGVHEEVIPNPLPGGTMNHRQSTATFGYRSFRMRDMYTYIE